jgi:hypothetical protein
MLPQYYYLLNLYAMLYGDGNLSFKHALTIHLSSQNLIFSSLLSWKVPRLKNDSLNFIKPVQKCESPGFLSILGYSFVLDVFYSQ